MNNNNTNTNNNKNTKSKISFTDPILIKLLMEGFWDKITNNNKNNSSIIIVINIIKIKTTATTNITTPGSILDS